MATSRALLSVRAFSSSAASGQMVKAPIQVFGLEGRYATALYSAASKEKKLDIVEKELTGFQNQMKADARLREFIKTPIIQRGAKKEALTKIGAALKLSSLSTNLMTLMAENGRLKSLGSVIGLFKTLMAAHRGEVACEVTTAKPLDEATRKELEGALNGFLKKGQTILLTTKVDPELLGGMIVSIGDKYVDMSIASKVKKMTEVISAAV
ncbi:ATP synthase subunit O, mitochondrial [Neocloeon triangulifer]|uniref:ATP synthase subunit O, mitochondrial n=1 Tax=Neocloeon triangulifer TaxID=2078957 RepID=UPI00286F25A0|nr:ATP synthase subunit O, mitochondrial [Neocloeon triangulifer]